MSTYRLDKLFAPRSVALVGASPRPGSLGRTVLQNLRQGGFAGTIRLVNPRYTELDGCAAVPDIEALPEAPDVVIVATPPHSVPGILARAGAKGAAAAVVITAGLGHGPGSLAAEAEKAARAHGLRLVGPNCLGVMAPAARLNASFAARMPRAGDLALVSQSGAIAAGLVEWAAARSVGFSAVVSLGDKLDVDFGDLLDHFALDRGTRAILLYVESINDARKFMSAARAAARAKPVVVVKSGRHAQGAKAAMTHTGALAGSDAVYDAAFRRAGLLRVLDLDELFSAAETLGRLKPFPGGRLAILTNGGGVGVLAVDRLIDLGGALATLSDETRARLDAVLPPTWSGANPIDIVGDADAGRYGLALEALFADPENDAILVMNVPTALASSVEAAEAVVEATRRERQKSFRSKPVFAVWIGEDGAASDLFETAAIPHFATEADAVQGFMHLVRYREARDLSMETPPSLPKDFVPDVPAAKAIVETAVAEGRTWLDPVEIDRLFAAYQIPITPTVLARDTDEAAVAAAPFLAEGVPVAVKILSPDIVHKSDVGGVRLNLTSEKAVREAAAGILARAREARPDARITGLTVHPMILRPKARELIAGLADDPTFGPVVVFGRGGTAVEVINDKALALPPLDLKLAETLIARTRVSRVLKAYRDVPAADEHAIRLVLVKLAQLAADLPEVRELDINPLLADKDGVIAVDARVVVAPVAAGRKGPAGHPRFAIRPYPAEWERRTALNDGASVFIRPVRPEDEDMFRAFFGRQTDEDLRLRFFAPVKEFSHSFIARLTQLDYARAMAFVAIEEASGEMLGAVRLHADANYDKGEYGIMVRSDLKGRGLGWVLMEMMIDYARAEGLKIIEGQVLRENTMMLAMCEKLGFRISLDPEDPDIRVVTLHLE
ncbi:bifunctional acetate--CoA ligase family protein/GNAT family N-acetyltransferase [Chelatococcus sp. SYSU_G07232]|uniref:Bifunctional acetate--CoA ligase family protein/GNAT family N-acetyltransferase n=1 Tax=Chelatococcus albus TaxID=3047466 RepID=A0ABT7AEZ1_9HYPH|nr:bifunctional acetate--CoA ligase family protein/GNAT family N-acetyltransferase [Chelatococcus sp. SYSU_G07232]MDJ1157939.1 bifunctional acetate--CoA ligase family protein/GNAT family N-acetyltransferase [Chelatococcus sp. SYSU_G07232]